MSDQNMKLVRELWTAVDQGGLEAALELTEPDVEWVPHQAGGRVLSSRELLAFLERFSGDRETIDATPYSFEAYEELVLASGSFRLHGERGLTEFQVHWVYEFDRGSLVRATSYSS